MHYGLIRRIQVSKVLAKPLARRFHRKPTQPLHPISIYLLIFNPISGSARKENQDRFSYRSPTETCPDFSADYIKLVDIVM
jgi:hypothetical protein